MEGVRKPTELQTARISKTSHMKGLKQVAWFPKGEKRRGGGGHLRIALPVLMESLRNNTVHWNLGREPAGHEPYGCMGTQGKGHEA